MFYKIFKKIQTRHGIKAIEIKEISGIGNQHLSEFGSGKVDLTSKKLWAVIEAMETISPGAKADFAAEIANFEDRAELDIDPVELVESATEEQLNEILLAIANRYRKEKEVNSRKSTEENKLKATV